MRDRPRGLSDAEVAEAVGRYWSVDVSEIEYAPVGFGSYHWIVTQTTGSRLFVTADSESSVTGSFADLEAAYATSGALRESGFEFVCAPFGTVPGGLSAGSNPPGALRSSHTLTEVKPLATGEA